MAIFEHTINIKVVNTVWKVADMRKRTVILIFTILLTGCFSSNNEWDGGFNGLPEIAKSCALGWIDYIDIVNSTELAINNLGFIPDKTLIIKSANSGWGTYKFFAVFEVDGKLMTLVNSPKYPKAVINWSQSRKLAELISNVDKIKSSGNNIVEGDTHNLSHTPCEFLYFKSGSEVSKFVFVGLFDKDSMNSLMSNLSLIKSTFNDESLGLKNSLTEMPIPPQMKIESLKSKIEQNIFFEIDALEHGVDK